MRHPLLYEIAQSARWFGTDAFPFCIEWADEHETWLRFIKDEGVLDRYLPRLRALKTQRDETFAEISPIYFFAKHAALPPAVWEPLGANGKRGEVLLALPNGVRMFVEVKSPGWETEIIKAQGRDSPRLKQEKYIGGEGRWTAPWAAVRAKIANAYPKMPASLQTLLVINGDLFESLNDRRLHVDIALYCCPRGIGEHPSGYLAENGYFIGNRYERLGGVGIFNVQLRAQGIEYRFDHYDNPNALAACAIPKTLFAGYDRFDGSSAISRSRSEERVSDTWKKGV